MKVTQQEKEAVLAVLAANPKATTRAMFHFDVVKKTGLTSPKVSAIRKELLAEGSIREERFSGFPIAIFLVAKDKRQQIIDLVMNSDTQDTNILQRYTGLNEEQVHQICIQLINEGLLEVVAMLIKPSRRLTTPVESPT